MRFHDFIKDNVFRRADTKYPLHFGGWDGYFTLYGVLDHGACNHYYGLAMCFIKRGMWDDMNDNPVIAMPLEDVLREFGTSELHE